MPVVSKPTDHLIAELLEHLAETADLSEACSVVLDRVVAEGGFERAFVAVLAPDGPRGVAWGLAEQDRLAFLDASREPDAPLVEVVRRGAPFLLEDAGPFRALGFRSCSVVPFAGRDRRPLGAAILEATRLDASVEFAAEVFRRCASSLERTARLERLEEETDKIAGQRELLTTIINHLPDPVLLTNSENETLLANRRADQLFSTGPDASEGRRRAIQINNLLFSSFLTQAVIGTRAATSRELNLVDPSDGSDLLFEVLSVPLPASVVTGEGSVISILRDITDLKRAVTELESQFNRSRVAEHQARHERDQLNVMLENVGDPILVTDDQSNIALMNRESERLFVAPPGGDGDVAKRNIVRANDTKLTTLMSDFLLQPDQRRVEKLELIDPDSSDTLPIEVVSTKIVNSRGEPTAIVSVLHDLTQVVENERLARELQHLNEDLEDRIRRATVELEEHNRRLEWQSQELERAYRLKSEFLANMSHELRTPINVVLGYTSLMREQIYGELTSQQEEALEKIYSTSQHLLHLINDILDLSKIEAGKMPVHLEEVRLGDVLAELAETVEPMLREKGLAYGADVGGDLPVLYTDRTKLKQILLNLLSNAIKFTHRGSVRVEASTDEKAERVWITVADTGIGIKPDNLETIFDDFRQVDQSHTREYGGTGLGLSITKKLLTLLGGTISVESDYGHGSRFTVVLPVLAEAGSVDEQVHRALMESDKAVVKG